MGSRDRSAAFQGELLRLPALAAAILLVASRHVFGLEDCPRRILTYDVSDLATGRALHSMTTWAERTDERSVVQVVAKVTVPGGASIESRALFRETEPAPRLERFERTTRDRSGTVVATENVRFSPEAFPLLRDPLPENAYPPELPIGFVLTRLGLGRRSEASFHTLVMDSATFRMDLWVEGRERLKVPAGELDTWRVAMRVGVDTIFPKLPAFVRPFASFFIPRHAIWLTVDEPQVVVRYEGIAGAPGSPELAIILRESRCG